MLHAYTKNNPRCIDWILGLASVSSPLCEMTHAVGCVSGRASSAADGDPTTEQPGGADVTVGIRHAGDVHRQDRPPETDLQHYHCEWP